MNNLIRFLKSEFHINSNDITTHLYGDRLLGIEVRCPKENAHNIKAFFPTSILEQNQRGEYAVLIEGDEVINLFSN